MKITPEMIAKANQQASWRDGKPSWLRGMADSLNRFIKRSARRKSSYDQPRKQSG